MRNRPGKHCPWTREPRAENSLESLQAILNCASGQGCGFCVPCSERALELFLKAARDHAGREYLLSA